MPGIPGPTMLALLELGEKLLLGSLRSLVGPAAGPKSVLRPDLLIASSRKRSDRPQRWGGPFARRPGPATPRGPRPAGGTPPSSCAPATLRLLCLSLLPGRKRPRGPAGSSRGLRVHELCCSAGSACPTLRPHDGWGTGGAFSLFELLCRRGG